MPSTAIDRIDGISTSEAVKAPVRVGTLANITLTGLQTIDGVVLVANDRVLVKNQTNQVDNGIYTAQVLTWIREPDFDGARDAVQGTIVQVYAGTTQALTWWNVSTANPIVIGFSSITFVQTYAGFNVVTQATETSAGIAEIATQAETDAGADDLRFVTPKKNATNMQIQKYFWVGTFGGTANALTCTLTPNPGAYAAGLRIIGIASADNSGAATLNSNTLGIKNISKNGASALLSGDIKSGQIVELNYDGTRFQQVNPSSSLVDLNKAQGRISLASGTPVTSGNITAATTIFYTPYKGNLHAVFNGTSWVLFSLAELSIPLPAAANTNYDLFLDYNSGTPQLALRSWTNQTTRAIALTTQDGINVLSGTLTFKFLGTVSATSVSGQTEDSDANRLCWNYYNRVPRRLFRQEAASSWAYSIATFRQANANTANKISVVSGLPEDCIDITVIGTASAAGSNGTLSIAIGLDSTTTQSVGSGTLGIFSAGVTNSASFRCLLPPQLGKHDLNWLEQGAGGGTDTWAGQGQSGLYGSFMA